MTLLDCIVELTVLGIFGTILIAGIYIGKRLEKRHCKAKIKHLCENMCYLCQEKFCYDNCECDDDDDCPGS